MTAFGRALVWEITRLDEAPGLTYTDVSFECEEVWEEAATTETCPGRRGGWKSCSSHVQRY